MKTLVIGKGKVGEATAASLHKATIDFHDPAKGLVVADFSDYSFAIVCVDTLRKGPHDHTDVLAVLNELVTKNFKGITLIRSTCNPEFVSQWKTLFSELRIVMFPEFMRQTDDLKLDDPWIVVIGGEPEDALTSQWFLHDNGYCDDVSKYHRTNAVEAAVIKLCQNAGLATKVIFFNMVNELCEKYGANYNRVRIGVGADKRVGIEYSTVPSPDDQKRGFKGHCLPKDVACLASIETHGFFTKLLEINKKLGRE